MDFGTTIANAFGGTFAKPHKPTLKPSFAKEPPSQRTTTNEMHGQTTYRQEGRTANKVLPQWGLTCFYETFVLKQTVVLLLNFGAKNSPTAAIPITLPASVKDDTTTTNRQLKREKSKPF